MFLFLFHVLCYDAWYYAIHIVLHYKIGLVIHKKHHFTKYDKMTYLDAHNGHIIEHIVQPLGIIIPCFITPIAYRQFILAILFTHIRGLMRHDNRFTWLIGNHHLLHHKHPKYNFGEYWMDILCGTKYPDESEYIYGIICM
jgi:sterol desaturase/sphingolipid hydroxylase (fatty acid hydroxylase superfamily)